MKQRRVFFILLLRLKEVPSLIAGQIYIKQRRADTRCLLIGPPKLLAKKNVLQWNFHFPQYIKTRQETCSCFIAGAGVKRLIGHEEERPPNMEVCKWMVTAENKEAKEKLITTYCNMVNRCCAKSSTDLCALLWWLKVTAFFVSGILTEFSFGLIHTGTGSILINSKTVSATL